MSIAHSLRYLLFISVIAAASLAPLQAQDELQHSDDFKKGVIVKAWRFKLIKDAYSGQHGDGSHFKVPPTPFGELIVSEDFSQCVYRYYRDGHQDSNVDSPYVVVVGSDGETYWTAGFTKRVEYKRGFKILGVEIPMEGFHYVSSKSASAINLFPDKRTLDKYHELHGQDLAQNSVLWYEDAHLHQLLNRLSVGKWNYENLVTAFEDSDACKTIFDAGKFQIELGKFGFSNDQTVGVPRSFYNEQDGLRYIEFTSNLNPNIDNSPLNWSDKNGGRWCYLVEIKKEAPFLSKCRVQFFFYGGFWHTGWGGTPFPTPLNYTIELEPGIIDVPADSFSFKHYSNADTKIKTMAATEK